MNNVTRRISYWSFKGSKKFTRITEQQIFRDGVFDALESFKSIIPGSLPCFDQDVIAYWLCIFNKKFFENPESKLYGYKQRCKAIAKYWLKYGKHSLGHNDPKINYCQILWNNHIKKYNKVTYGTNL